MLFSQMPVAGCMRWGKWGANFSTNEYAELIGSCIDNDITAFDHADIYGSYTTEYEFGAALRMLSYKRESFQLITKCGIQIISENKPQYNIKSYNTSAAHLIQTAEQSLRDFNTDYIDLFLIHRPDPLLNPEEVASAITDLKQQGKILHFGVSNFYAHQTNVLKKYIDVEYNQLEISLFHLPPFTNGVLDYCIEQNIIPMAWAPLGGGIINDETHARYRSISTVAAKLAKKYETGLNQILIAWLYAHPAKIIPVVGTTKLERLLQAKEAFNIELNREDWFDLYTASSGEDVP
jgi:predicted oxidoreductase